MRDISNSDVFVHESLERTWKLIEDLLLMTGQDTMQADEEQSCDIGSSSLKDLIEQRKVSRARGDKMSEK